MIVPIARIVYVVGVVGISIFGFFELIKTQINKGIFRKRSVHGNEIEIFSDAEDSYFDKYHNEVFTEEDVLGNKSVEYFEEKWNQ